MAVDTIQKAAEVWRKRLREPDLSDPLAGAQERLLARSYVNAWDVLKKKWDFLAAQVNSDPTRRTAGALYRMERYKTLMRAVEEQLDALSTEAVTAAQDGGFRSIDAAINQMVREHRPAGYDPAHTGDWDVRGDRVRAEAITAFNSEFSPLTDLFKRYGDAAAVAARQAVVSGVIAGVSTDEIGRQLRKALGTSLWHSQLIARTEAHRAYRESQRIFVEQNNDVFRGYVWRAACDSKTCAICWERHGTFYPVWVDKAGEPHAPPMETHPGCRCALVPRPRSLADIVGDKSIEDVRPKDTGREKFAALPVASQRRVLGPKRLALYQNGTKLSEMIELRSSGRWGRTPRLKSLKELGAPPKPKPLKVAKVEPPKPGGAAPTTAEIQAKMAEYRAKKKEWYDARSEYLTADSAWNSTVRTIGSLDAGAIQSGYSYRLRAPNALKSIGQTQITYIYLDRHSYDLASAKPFGFGKVRFRELLAMEQTHWNNETLRLHKISLAAEAQAMTMQPEIMTFPTRMRLDPTKREALAPTRRIAYDDFMAAVAAYEEVILPQYGYTGRSRWGGGLDVTRSKTFGGQFGWGDEAPVTISSDVFAGRKVNDKGFAPGAGSYSLAKFQRYHRGDYLKVVLHEAGHSMNGLKPAEYSGKRGWEEGVVEKAAIVFEEDFWKAAGLRGAGYSKKLPAGAGLKNGYRTYSKYTDEWDRVLRLINGGAVHGRKGSSVLTEKEFYGRLLTMRSPEREAYVRAELKASRLTPAQIDSEIAHMDAEFRYNYT